MNEHDATNFFNAGKKIRTLKNMARAHWHAR